MAATEPSRSPITWMNAARVFTLSRSRDSDQATSDVDGKADERDGEHPESLDGHRRADPVERLEEDPGDDREHRDRVDEGRDHLDPRQPERVPVGHRTARDDVRRQREQQRRGVGGHVSRVGQQRQRARTRVHRRPRPARTRRSARRRCRARCRARRASDGRSGCRPARAPSGGRACARRSSRPPALSLRPARSGGTGARGSRSSAGFPRLRRRARARRPSGRRASRRTRRGR